MNQHLERMHEGYDIQDNQATKNNQIPKISNKRAMKIDMEEPGVKSNKRQRLSN